MATVIIKTNSLQGTNVLIDDMGIIIPSSGGSETLTQKEEIDQARLSIDLKTYLTDGAFGINGSTLILNDGTQDIPESDVDLFLAEASGIRGPTGLQGFTGIIGDTGIVGLTGSQGETGPIVPLDGLLDVTTTGLQTGQLLGYTGTEWVNTNGPNITREPTGFVDPEDVTVTYSSVARTITLTGTFKAYWRGYEVKELTNGWVSPAHAVGPTSGLFLYYTESGGFQWSTVPWDFDFLLIAYVAYDSGGTFRFAVRECHGLMPWQTHKEAHDTIGTYKSSGGGLTSYVADSTTAADRRPDVEATVVQDEDLPSIVAALTSNSYTQYYLSGSGAAPNYVTGQSDIVPLSGSQPYYNEFTGGSWQQTLVPDTFFGGYTSVWVVAVPTTADAASQAYRYLWVQGQSTGTLGGQLALFPQDVVLGDLENIAPEFVFIAQVILLYDDGDWVIDQVVTLTGSRAIQVGSPQGSYLTSVTTGDGLTGLGTTDSPLVATNVTGPQGETGYGIQGATGLVGQTGIQGSTGSQGETGPQGETGSQGQTGPQGGTGIIGTTGETGAQGSTGIQGATGLQGETGIAGGTGLQGATGFQGVTGLSGVTGLQGETGSQGIDGDQGLTGLQGLDGDQGVTGLQGITGLSGDQGGTGLPGVTGLQGETGAKGETGSDGLTGFQGATGSQGSTGFQGVTGSQGSTGLQGVTGAQGETGLQGSTGTQGETGLQGSTGIQGDTGSSGVTGFQGTTGISGETGVQGETGVPGEAGETGLQGSTGVEGLGVTGLQGVTGVANFLRGSAFPGSPTDRLLFWDNEDEILYFYDAVSQAWIDISSGSIASTGPQGATGQPGEAGETGSQGIDGETGLQGETGVQGISGETGLQGTTGVQGYQGETGSQGITGAQGIDGETGSQGITGVQGINGETGIQGETGLQGVTGLSGSTGLQGSTGVEGLGVTGLQGVTGVANFLRGSAFPGSPTDRLLFWDNEDEILYFYDAVSQAWIDISSGSIASTGPQGETGQAGNPGSTGLSGPTGVQGETGTEGLGTTGLIGPTGFQGETGAQGETGVEGSSGSSGETGVQGETGAQGSDGSQGETGVEGGNLFSYQSADFDNPNTSDWTVNSLAPATVDPTNTAIPVRAFDDTTEEGVGFMFTIPPGTTSLRFYFKHRAATAPGEASAVIPKLYFRTIDDNASISAWSNSTFTGLTIPTNANYQYDNEIKTLSTLSLTAADLVQFELTRDAGNGSDNLTGDWYLADLTIGAI